MLKENLYKDILLNFEKGSMWESAIQVIFPSFCDAFQEFKI